MRRFCSYIITALILYCFLACDRKNSATQDLELSDVVEQPDPKQSSNQRNDEISNSRHNAITNAVQKVSAAVCGINVTQIRESRFSPFYDDPFFRYFFQDRIPREAVKSLGSGFLVSQDGFILTNEHVVHNAAEILVVLSDGSTKEAKVIGTDYITDLALIKIEGGNYPFITMGNSDDIIIGEWVIAIGNPFGLFEINSKPTVTVGVVSAVDRDFGRLRNDRVYQDMIQTDAAINQGNSGGPLVNSLGEVIGMNTFIYTESQYNTGSIGIGFAIPSNRIKRVFRDLKKYGEVNRRWTSGLSVDDITPLMARYFRLDTPYGVIITDIEADSPAARAGLEVGDIIVQVNDKKVRDKSDIWSIIEESDLRGGDEIKLAVVRDKKLLNFQLRLKQITK